MNSDANVAAHLFLCP